MLRNFFSTYFWITWAALSLASSLFFFGSFQNGASHLSLLLIPKTETAIVAPANAVALLQSALFETQVRSTLAAEANTVDEAWLKQVDWKHMVSGDVLAQSSVLVITTEAEEGKVSRVLLGAITKELIRTLNQWYDVQTELDFRIIDGPHTLTKVSSWPLFLALVVGSGLAITVAFFLLLSWLEHWPWFAKNRSHPGVGEYHISPETFQPKVVPPYWSRNETASTSPALTDTSLQETEYVYPAFEHQPELPQVAELDPGPFEEELPVSENSIATGPAPDNLPFLDDLSPLEAANARLYKADIDATATTQAKTAEQQLFDATASASPENDSLSTAEPSQEEYKRRLNELLSGRL